MEKRIDLERRGKEPSKIKELNLDNTRATHIEGLTEDYVNLESLSLINVGLTSLKGFPKLQSLKKLELSDNRISAGLAVLKECNSLTHLNLSGNKVKDLEALEPLKSLEKLTHLDLFNNEVSNIDEYRKKVFELLPSLKYLDGFDPEENEAESGAEDGANGTLDDDDEDDEEDGGEEEEDVDDEEEEDGEDEDDEDEGPGLKALYNSNFDGDEEDADEDFDEEGEEEEEDVDEEEEEESEEPRGKRRRVEEEDESGDA